MKRAKVYDLLRKINGLLQDAGELSSLEKELVKQHLRNMYEALDEDETPVKEAVQVEKPVTVLIPPPVEKAKEIPIAEPLPAEKEKVITVVKEEPAFTPPAVTLTEEKLNPKEKSAINERVKTDSTLNEKIKPVPVTEMHSKFGARPLKELIDFNKKFLFINELFKGDSAAYTSTIQKIDASQSIEEALSHISTHAWDETTQSARLFSKLVKQRFSAE